MEEHLNSVDAIEAIIEQCRQDGDWEGLMRELETFSNLFDLEELNCTSQHRSFRAVKAYYWTCLAEATFEQKLDVMLSIECCAKSLAADPEYVDAKIILSRILLEVGSGVLNTCGYGLRSRRRTREIVLLESEDKEKLAELLHVSYHRFFISFLISLLSNCQPLVLVVFPSG